MTAMLSCDGCGQIVSDRPTDEDPTAAWWRLSSGPAIGENGMLPMISLASVIGPEDDTLPIETFEIPDPEPDRHFCSVGCVGSWTDRRMAGAT